MSLRAIDPTCRRALSFTPMETNRQTMVEAAVLADQLGYESVSVPEGWGFDAGVILAEIAVRTERIQLASGIFSVWGRSAATLAMTAASLDDLSGGRFTLGLGASTPILAERFHGVAFHRPVERLRSVATGARALLDGERVPALGEGRGLALGLRPERRIPINIAALGPRTTRVATDIGDAWAPVMVPRSRLPEIRRRALAAAQRDPELICGPLAGVATDADGSVLQAEQLAGWYLTGMGRLYGDFVAANGFAAEIEALRIANPKPRPGRINWPSEADSLLPELAVFGTPTELAQQLTAWDGSADVVPVVLGPAPLDAVLAAVEAAAPPRGAASGLSG